MADAGLVVQFEVIVLIALRADSFRLAGIAACEARAAGEIVLREESGQAGGAGVNFIEALIAG